DTRPSFLPLPVRSIRYKVRTMPLKISETFSGPKNQAVGGWRNRLATSPVYFLVGYLIFLTACAGGGAGKSVPPASGALINFAPENVDFGAWRIGTTSSPQNLNITNSGNATLTVTGVAISGSSTAAYSVINNNCGD